MNTLTSYDWLKHYVDLKGVSVEEFAKRVSLSGPGVEKIYPQGVDLQQVVVGHVTSVEKHPDADKLRLASVDVGEKKALTIVCGGLNLAEDQWVAVALVGARVRWHGEGDLITLEPATIRGVASEGMICAANEIGLAEAFPHAEREILDLGVAIPEMKLKAGTPLADALGLAGDAVLDSEVTTNRVDAMGVVGFAREASAILGKKFLWKPATLKAKGSKKGAPTIHVSEKKLCPRYMAVRLTGVKNGPSPWWLKKRLMQAGLNSISALVDITNYVMLELAQPMHVFDVARLAQGKKGLEISVRLAKKGETLKTFDGNEHHLDEKTLVIADAEGPVAIAGVMGGERSGAYYDTTDIIFEAATFDAVSVRRTARRLNLYSDSQTRFEKGLSPHALPDAIARAVELALDICGGTVVGSVVDERAAVSKPATYRISTKEVDERIGVSIPKATQIRSLRDLGFTVKLVGGTIHATVPWWRDQDIESGQDLVEEIARIYGYANIPPVVPGGTSLLQVDPSIRMEDTLKTIAAGAGLTETYTYSFVSDDLYRKAGYDSSGCLHVQNPLTEEFAFMRTSLLPSLLQVVAENQERAREQRLFEIANVYYPPSTSGVWNDLPDEHLEMGCAFLGDNAFANAKGFVEHVLATHGITDVFWKRLTEKGGFWHAGRSVQAFKDGALLATVGEVAPNILGNMGIDGRVAMVDCPLTSSDGTGLFTHAVHARQYTVPSPFPESKRDLALVVPDRTEYAALSLAIRRVDACVASVEWFDTYAGKGLPEQKKSVAMHLTFSAPNKTLTSEEVDALIARITSAVKKEFGAEVR
ncbi:MAG: Phenylalanine-tRNA ligase beta subunit [Candidatus Parcubacteria bacterium]|jgi:phenylalanyl-tRNA synthetase beta chain